MYYFLVCLQYAISGRPQVPQTVKNRSPIERNLYKLQYTCARSSFSRLLAAYKEAGWSTGSASLNGVFVFFPQTDEEEAYIKGIFISLMTSSNVTKQRTFARTYSRGCVREQRTPAQAAK
eukprot:TRINITY_DN7759_c0_g1_i1.p3 TRINITY_DN7759_c0_g1~~TRINITY_DN7759_c0_g1_i1.p3  ORF type:complete len:120 (-),score=3.65 TRINITY_DN7759_c0_g1_i1:22-381(-)